MTSAGLGVALRAGASGALPKTSSQAEIVAAIRKVAAGERVVSKALERDLKLNRLQPELTERQTEVLRLAAKGITSQDIGSILAISQNSVKDHLKLIYQRLGVSTRAEAIAVAMHGGMLSA